MMSGNKQKGSFKRWIFFGLFVAGYSWYFLFTEIVNGPADGSYLLKVALRGSAIGLCFIAWPFLRNKVIRTWADRAQKE